MARINVIILKETLGSCVTLRGLTPPRRQLARHPEAALCAAVDVCVTAPELPEQKFLLNPSTP